MRFDRRPKLTALAGRVANELFARRLDEIDVPPNQAWSVVWVIDYVCNLKCVYCDNAGKHETYSSPDNREKAIRQILAKRPGTLTITGGEPALIPGLVDIIGRLHAGLPLTDITLNTSLAAKSDALYESLFPFLGGLSVSLDGAGEVNAMLRGVDGDRILQRLERLTPALLEHDVNLYVNCVVTKLNYARFTELFEALNRINPRVLFGLAPVVPMDHELSVFSSPALAESFFAEFRRLQEKYGDRIDFNGYPELSIRCYSQFLDAFIYPDGSFATCAAKKFSHDFTAGFFSRYALKHGKRDHAHVAEFMRDFARRRPSPLCFRPCNTSHKLNTTVDRDPALRQAIFAPSRSITDALTGSLVTLKHNLLRRKLQEKFFTAASPPIFGRFYHETMDWHAGRERYDCHALFRAEDADLRDVAYDMLEDGGERVRLKLRVRQGPRWLTGFPHYVLCREDGSWRLSLPDMLPTLAGPWLPGFPSLADGVEPPEDAATTPRGWRAVRVTAGAGSERPGPDDGLRLHWVLWTCKGEVLRSTVDWPEPELTNLQRLHPGIAEVVRLMGAGEKWRVWFPMAVGDELSDLSDVGVVGIDLELVAIKPRLG